MRRNCNLELRLFPSSFPGERHDDMVEKSSHESPQNQQQQLTIFYNGRVCVCDVTELQARAILMVANRELMDERLIKTPTGGSEPASPSSSTVSISHQLYSPTNTMKKSLQRFLQKRKNRIQATSPYH